jgi:hypothetical protein
METMRFGNLAIGIICGQNGYIMQKSRTTDRQRPAALPPRAECTLWRDSLSQPVSVDLFSTRVFHCCSLQVPAQGPGGA